MGKVEKYFVCSNCGYKSPKWLGKCPSCGMWNTFEEAVYEKKAKNRVKKGDIKEPLPLREISSLPVERFSTGYAEFDRVLGGGFVPGSLVLLAGEPGIGKSTLALQAALSLTKPVLYVSGEESLQQLKLRAERLEVNSDSALFLAETNLENIFEAVKNIEPALVVIDSVQTTYTEKSDAIAGSVSQIRETVSMIQQFAKDKHITFLLIGHITKEGSIAGPKILEHIVDTVLYFGGEKNYLYRILRSVKNRFGATSELAIFEMSEKGLFEIKNPSEILLSENFERVPGVTVGAVLEGLNPLLLEVQALVSSAVYSAPQRITTGFDTRRLNMLIAVLEKRLGYRLGNKDVFINIAGGIKVSDTALDLPVIISILSSDQDLPVKDKICFTGEVSLSGEIKPVYRLENRISEAEKLGFKRIIIPDFGKLSFRKKLSIDIVKVKNIQEAVKVVFSGSF